MPPISLYNLKKHGPEIHPDPNISDAFRLSDLRAKAKSLSVHCEANKVHNTWFAHISGIFLFSHMNIMLVPGDSMDF